MSTAEQATAFQRATDPVLRLLTREQIEALVNYQGDDELRNRIDELAVKSTEGELTLAERNEYEGYIRAKDFIATLQARARNVLASY